MIQLYKVIDELSRYPVHYFDLTDYEHNVIVPELTILQYFKDVYSMYYMKMTLDKAWTDFLNLTYDDFMSMWFAWNTEYKPLNNYDMSETSTSEKSHGTETNTNTQTLGSSSTTSNSGANPPTTKHYTTTYDSVSENRLDNYDLSTGETSTTLSGTNTDTNVKTYTNTTLHDLTAHDVDYNTVKRYGNIGVTTSQQMLQSEIDLRLKHLIELYLEQFCKKYMFFCGGVDNVYIYSLS